MKLDRDIMIDLETLATSSNSAILTIAGIRFNFSKEYRNIDNPYLMDYFYCRVDTESQYYRDIDDDTVEWWSKQDQEAKIEAFSPEDRLSFEDAMLAFNHWAAGGDRYWANGAAFDFPVLESANRQLGFTSPWKYWQAMDARTVYKLCPVHYSPTKFKHHALFDCLNQIHKLTDCFKRMNIKQIS